LLGWQDAELLMVILVTGGAGYLGSVLCELLLRSGQRVRAFDSLLHGGRALLGLAGREGFEFQRGDVRDGSALRGALHGVDAVVHLAAIVGDPACAREPELARAVNLTASLDLFAAARSAGVQRFLFASTCSNYGRMVDLSVLATESHELRPVSLYAETKVGVEQTLLAAAAEPTAATVLRLSTLYGLSPRMRFDLTVNEFVKELVVQRKLVVFGEQFWRPYVHVRDAARAFALVLETPAPKVAGQVFNVGDTRENYRKADLLELMSERLPDADVQRVQRSEDPRDYRVSFERIRERLGFAITRRVSDGIAEIATALETGLIEDPADPAYYNVRS
jgi:nucleoside-diphosphate-sugar epimerase